MEKTKYRNKKLYITKLVALCVLVLLSISINILTFYKNKEYTKENYQLMEKYQKYQEENITNNSELQNYYTQIEFLKNIDDNISTIKKDLFKNSKDLEDQINSGKANKKIAYLTFDDGPYYLTYKYLEVLNKYNVKATFFTIGTGKSKCYDNSSQNCYLLYKEIVDNGHTIANHTYSHAIWKGLYTSADTFMSSISKQEELLKKYTGVTTNIMRFPGGSSTPGKAKKNSIITKLRAKGYGWVDWTAADGDGGGSITKDQAWKNFTSSINSSIEVVLLHDYNYTSLSLLPEFIEYLRNKNYVLLPLFYESNMINK